MSAAKEVLTENGYDESIRELVKNNEYDPPLHHIRSKHQVCYYCGEDLEKDFVHEFKWLSESEGMRLLIHLYCGDACKVMGGMRNE